MRIGLLSDSHGNLGAMARAAEMFTGRVDAVIHCGDVTSPQHLEPLLQKDIAVHLVRGNCDWNERGFKKYELNNQLVYHGAGGLLNFNSSSIAFTHGHSGQVTSSLLNQNPDYLIHGHTHERTDYFDGNTRVINPGAASSSAAILDTSSGEVEFIDLYE